MNQRNTLPSIRLHVSSARFCNEAVFKVGGPGHARQRVLPLIRVGQCRLKCGRAKLMRHRSILPGSLCHSHAAFACFALDRLNRDSVDPPRVPGQLVFASLFVSLRDLMDFGVAQCSGRYAGPDTRLDEPRSSGSCALILLLLPNSLFITDGASTLRRPTPS